MPVVYARKHKPITMREPVYVEVAPSHTKGGEVILMVSPEFLQETTAYLSLMTSWPPAGRLTPWPESWPAAGASLVGIAAVVEKTFEDGAEAAGPLGACLSRQWRRLPI